jgi:hypothetical protein
MLKDLTEQFATNGCHNITGQAWKKFKSLPLGGCGHITMTVRIWLWVDLHQSRNWPWLHNVSTSDSLAKGEDYQSISVIAPDDLTLNLLLSGGGVGAVKPGIDMEIYRIKLMVI